ncbi:MAG TPA: zinc-binding dehydrogenase [Candidatus Aquilonibacter sp.]|nr:zinc-binding dehydrogenase [Candidatus Aquilonibacter sp.]
MKALVITRFSGLDALTLQDVAEPAREPNATSPKTIVRVAAGGLNFADVMTTLGGYPGTPPPPLIAGREFAGVEETSGRRVMGYAQWAAFAEKTAANPALLWPVPDHWSDEQAAAFPVNFFTAYLAYWQAGMAGKRQQPAWEEPPSSAVPGKTRRSPRVLIHAAAGGVGTAAIQIGRILGVEMFGTSSSDEKLARVQELGLQHGINYKQRDYEEAIKQLTGGEGVDAVFDMLGGEHTAKSLRCLCDFGRIIQYGTATGKSPRLDVRALYAKSAILQGLWLTYLSGKSDIMKAAWNQLSSWIAQKQLSPQVGHIYSLAQARQAYELLYEGKNYGKIVLRI